MKNPQTTFVPTFLTHIIARIDGVQYRYFIFGFFRNVLGTFCKIWIKATSEESILNDQSLSLASKSNKKAPESQESRLICQNISR